MHYSLGNIRYSARIYPEYDHIYVVGIVEDTYDFNEIRKHDDKYSWLSVEANNLGYNLERDGFGIEYDISFPFAIKIYER